MSKYRVVVARRPDGWEPKCPDDVPAAIEPPAKVVAESENLFEAVRQAIYFNEKPRREESGRWAVVVDPESVGRRWPEGRIVTPIAYKVAPIWWPEGWEPDSPRDVPNCVWKAKGGPAEAAESYGQAEAAVLALNRQAMDRPGTTWYVVVAIENEPVSTTVAFDSRGMETTSEARRLHVVRPEQGGHGNCDRCPAHSFSCAQADWSDQVQTITDTQSRSLRSAATV